MPAPTIPLNFREAFWTGGGFDFEGTDLDAGGNLRVRFYDDTVSSTGYDIDTTNDLDEFAADEIAACAGSPSYTPGDGNGIAPSSPSVAKDTTNDRVELDFGDVTLGQDATGPTDIQWMMVAKYDAADANALIVGAVDAGATKSVQSGDLVWQLDAEGFMYW